MPFWFDGPEIVKCWLGSMTDLSVWLNKAYIRKWTFVLWKLNLYRLFENFKIFFFWLSMNIITNLKHCNRRINHHSKYLRLRLGEHAPYILKQNLTEVLWPLQQNRVPFFDGDKPQSILSFCLVFHHHPHAFKSMPSLIAVGAAFCSRGLKWRVMLDGCWRKAPRMLMCGW